MTWLSNSKVRLALIVNGLYFISLFTPAAHHRRARLFAQPRGPLSERPAPGAPNRATSFSNGSKLYVTLSQDLPLVQRTGWKLLLSPSLSESTGPAEEPDFVLLTFILYSADGVCPGDCPLTITADGVTVWTSYSHGNTPGWERQYVPPSSSELGDGQVVKTMGVESLSTKMSYNNFIDMISAKHIFVRFGPDRVELNDEQLEALRDMYRLLPPPSNDSDTD
jgi:hypothetical protein